MKNSDGLGVLTNPSRPEMCLGGLRPDETQIDKPKAWEEIGWCMYIMMIIPSDIRSI